MTREAYGYVGGNPLNFTDPSGLYRYSYSYDIGEWGPNAATNVMGAIQADPASFFPFGIEGANGETSLRNGHTYDLRPLGVKVDSVRVTGMTATSFSFRTLSGHSEGENASIRFSTAVNRRGHLMLTVCASGPDGRVGRIFNPGRHFVARRFWRNMAGNISDYANWASDVA